MYSAPFDVYFDEETVVEPDILFVSQARLHIIDERKVNGAPDMVVEIISESTEQHDRGFKFKRYAQEGVTEYSIVDPAGQKIEVYQLSKKGFTPSGIFSGTDDVTSPIFPKLRFSTDKVWG